MVEFETTDVVEAKLKLIKNSAAYAEHVQDHKTAPGLHAVDEEAKERNALERVQSKQTSLEASLQETKKEIAITSQEEESGPQRKKVFFAQCTCGQTFELEGSKTKASEPSFVEETNEYGLAAVPEEEQNLYSPTQESQGNLYE